MIARLAPLLLAMAPPLAGQNAGTPPPVERHLRVGDRDRTYRVDVPPNVVAGCRLPLVLLFHGGGGSPDGARTQSGFSALGARVGAIVVYPAGRGRFGDERVVTWNTGSCCGYARGEHRRDRLRARALDATQVAWSFFTAHPRTTNQR